MSDGYRALRARQGAGARWDDPAAPHEALLLARRGAAYFARILNGLADDALDPRRRRVIVAQAYGARALAETLAAMRMERPAPAVDGARRLAVAASLPAHALRHLVQHAEAHLSVEWRDLRAGHWARALSVSSQQPVPVRDLPQHRAQVVWQAALDLAAGGRLLDVPEVLRPKIIPAPQSG